MNVLELFKNISVLASFGNLETEVSGIVFDSRKVSSGSLYVAMKGVVQDGHTFIDSAVEKGARCIVCENLPEEKKDDVVYVQVKNARLAIAHLAKNFYDDPSQKLNLVGITGTNGKTSTATLLFNNFSALGLKSALISTVEYRIGNEIFPASHTTPDVLQLNEILSKAVREGCKYAFMEVSSHGIHQDRVEALCFKVAGFTNISRDHLDYHETFSEYLNVKKSFFDGLTDKTIAITNIDDRNGTFVLQNTKAIKKSYALKTMADYHGRVLEVDFNGMLLNFGNKEFWTSLTGKHNAYNLLLVFAIASELGLDKDEILKVLSKLSTVKGRFETIRSPSGIFFVIDYAHTPDALINVLSTINDIRTGNERLICLFGCGGNRDEGKRHQMGKIATQNSTLAIITSDNPRSEDPLAIIKDIESGVEPSDFNKYISVPNRREAIKTAIKFAEKGDIILIAGKGHESYQEIEGVKHHFNDREIVENLLKIMSK